jgi:hypothetical protein
MFTRKKRTTVNSGKGASSPLDKELNPSNLLTQGEELPEPNPTAATTKETYEAELAKLRKEANELAKTKKRLLVVYLEAEATKEIQRHKAKITELQEELHLIKAKQFLCFNQPSLEYSAPNQSTYTKGDMPFTQPPPHTTFSRNPFINPFESGPFNPGTLNRLCLQKSKSPRGHSLIGSFHSLGFWANRTLDNS